MTDAAGAIRRRLPVADRVAVIAVVLLLVVLVLSGTDSDADVAARPFDFGAAWLLAVGIGLVVAGRRAPATAALGNLVVTVVWYQVGYPSSLVNIPYLAAFYLLGASGDRRKQLLVGGLAVVVTGTAILLAGESTTSAAAAIGWTLTPLLFGELAHNRRALLDELASRAERAERERDREAERRVAQARLEIARDLHDVLAHTVSVMMVQAGVGLDALHRDPEAAEAAFRNVRDAGRRAVAEVQALIALLRAGSVTAETAPAPTLDRIDDLADAARATGLAVQVDVDVPDGISEVVQVTAYRVVQESLTNVVRHAAARSVSVRIHTDDDALVVDVTDDGRGGAVVGEGLGLQGMRERVEALGGSLVAGPDGSRGWRVSARLPNALGGAR